MALRCEICDEIISPERIEAFLDATGKLPQKCIKCAHVGFKKSVVLMDYAHKTAGEAVVIDGENPNFKENLRRAKRVYKRSR
jgi:6-phosphogluconate dehydrogenase (decarboxylating)